MPEIKTVAVIGAGTMGRGIAHVAALGGFRTILEDLLPNALRKAESDIRANLDKSVELGKVSAAAAHTDDRIRIEHRAAYNVRVLRVTMSCVGNGGIVVTDHIA